VQVQTSSSVFKEKQPNKTCRVYYLVIAQRESPFPEMPSEAPLEVASSYWKDESMKTLLLLRHAKTEKESPEGDEARALTERGKRDAEIIGRKIAELVGCPDVIVASNARRAQQTAEIVTAEVEFVGPVTTEASVYAAYPDELLRVVRHLPDKAGSALLIGHNPGFEDLAGMLVGAGAPQPHLTTAGLAYLEFDVKRWRDVSSGAGRLRGVYSPKEIEPGA
jgi:phosphohistidine phosphatase